MPPFVTAGQTECLAPPTELTVNMGPRIRLLVIAAVRAPTSDNGVLVGCLRAFTLRTHNHAISSTHAKDGRVLASQAVGVSSVC